MSMNENSMPSPDDRTQSDEENQSLQARLATLEAENERLREEYRRATQATYRRTALALGVVGAVGIAAAIVLPSVREVLLVLGAIGIFGGVLTYYLTPERVLTAGVATHIADTHMAVLEAMVDELGLQDRSVYIPADSGIRLFIPEHHDYHIPASLDRVFVVTEAEAERGVAVPPIGAAMFDDFERALTADLATNPDPVLNQLTDGLVEQFEIVDSATSEISAADKTATVSIAGPAIPRPARIDHPIESFLAVGLARGLDTPITTSVETAPEEETLIQLTWESGS